MLLQVVLILEGLETFGALELPRPPRLGDSPRRRLRNLTLRTGGDRGTVRSWRKKVLLSPKKGCLALPAPCCPCDGSCASPAGSGR